MIKEDDFVEIEYTGKLKDGSVFDTTDENKAKEAGIYNPNMRYGPIIIQLNDCHLVNGLVDFMIGKEPGKYEVELTAEDAFGKKSAKLIQLVPTNKFKQANINPHPGLQINVDGAFGIIKTVNGGRTLVDFNHPLSGKDVFYDFEVKRVIEDPKEKIESIIDMNLKIDVNISIEGKNAKIEFGKKVSEGILKVLEEKIKKIGLEKIEFTVKGSEKNNSKSDKPIDDKSEK